MSDINKYFTICISLLISNFVIAQNSNFEFPKSNKEIIEYSNSVYGTNNLLINGRIYVPSNIKAEGFPYFSDNEWKLGTLFIKEEVFNRQFIKYNIELDRIILNKEFNSTFINIELNSSLIDSFYIEDIIFKKEYNNNDYRTLHKYKDRLYSFQSEIKKTIININGSFYHQIYRGNISLFKRHYKRFLKKYSQLNPLGCYTKEKVDLYISVKEEILKISNKKMLLNLFLNNKNQLKKYFRKNKINLKKSTDLELSKLMQFINNLRLE